MDEKDTPAMEKKSEELSKETGNSPKEGNSPKKEPSPRSKVEAILKNYRESVKEKLKNTNEKEEEISATAEDGSTEEDYSSATKIKDCTSKIYNSPIRKLVKGSPENKTFIITDKHNEMKEKPDIKSKSKEMLPM